MSMTDATPESSYDIIARTLKLYKLEELAATVHDLVFKENILNENILMGKVRETEAYRQRFIGNEQRRNAGLNTLSEAEYLQQEDAYQMLFRNAGLPSDMFADKTITDALIGNNVSVEETSARIETAYSAVANADPEVIQEMRRLYNIDDGKLAAYFLDPERMRPTLIRQAQAAQIAGQAKQEGFQIDVGTAEQLARAGVTSQQAEASFQALTQGQELFATTAEEQQAGQRAFTQEEQIGAVFGTSAAAQQRLRQRARQRQAAFETGGRFASQGAEVTGLQ